MNILAQITRPHLKQQPAQLRTGDTVRVHQRIRDIDAKGKERERTQIFEGIVIATNNGSGIEGTFTVRKIAAGSIGVERVYPLHSPMIIKIEVVKTARVRQSKLYYLRDLRSSAMRLRKEVRVGTTYQEPVAVEAVPEAAPAAPAAAVEEVAPEEAATVEAPVEAETSAETPTESPAETSSDTPSVEAE